MSTPPGSGQDRPVLKTGGPAFQRWRHTKDVLARRGIALGGIGLIIALLLIFLYLLQVVIPLFRPASMQPVATYALPGGDSPTLYLAMEELAETGLRVTGDGRAVFFDLATGEARTTVELHVPAGANIVSFAAGDPNSALLALGLDDGRVVVFRHVYKVTFPDDVRTITPGIEFPLGEDPIVVHTDGAPVRQLTVQADGDNTTIVSAGTGGVLALTSFERTQSLLGGAGELESAQFFITAGVPERIGALVMNRTQRELYVADDRGNLSYFDISDKAAPRLLQTISVTPDGASVRSLRFLTGGISLIVGGSRGQVSQWFPVRDAENNYHLQRVRTFDAMNGPVTDVAADFNRKAFVVADASGQVRLFHATAHRTVLTTRIAAGSINRVAVAPRANALLAEDSTRQLHFARVHNEHPGVSWSALWGKVWYESYAEPQYRWQSSSASNDFEPKFSLTPITFGTIKAAFYAMLFAVPLSVLGAIFTGYFMAPRMRRLVKPTVEIMEALPTVILGFLAGLWLAPFMESHLPGVASLLLVLPVGVLAFAYAWHRMPGRIRQTVPDGWEAALVAPVLIALVWAALALSEPVENWLFGGDIRVWLTSELGIGFDQRNALVVGIAMGFAVVPTIFSIAEDAIFAVPRHLTQGSLALGATPWQTLSRVVILTASPGIFSAVMIGLGRAVGETMIVLMATGNTPLMDWSIFQGMRTLSANIAVEMPESEVGSTHYRVLFLAGLVLFMATFIFNTAAEIVRQRLRRKYSSL